MVELSLSPLRLSNKHSIIIGAHNLKKLYTEYEHCTSYSMWVMNLISKVEARVNVDGIIDEYTYRKQAETWTPTSSLAKAGHKVTRMC